MTIEAPWRAALAFDQVAFGVYTLTTLFVYFRASAAAASASLRFPAACPATGPTMSTTLGLIGAVTVDALAAPTPMPGTAIAKTTRQLARTVAASLRNGSTPGERRDWTRR